MKKIISIDGGGVRGIVAAHILSVLENKLQSPLHEYVDLVSGTSTGSIIGAGVSDGIPMSDMLDFYYTDASKIFNKKNVKQKFKSVFGLKGPRYDIKDLIEALENRYTANTLGELKTDFLCPAYNMTKGETHFYSKRNEPNTKLSEAVASSSAAPTYLGPLKTSRGDMADGGLFSSSPAMCAYAEMKDMEPGLRAENIFVLSVGTGNRTVGNNKSYKWVKTKWIKVLIDTMMSTDPEIVNYQLKRIYSSIYMENNYVRINGILPGNINKDMDDASYSNLKDLHNFAKELTKAHDYYLDKSVEQLKK